jgi:molybdate transport system ATP-binding protein
VATRKRSRERASLPLIELSHCSLILGDHEVLGDVSFALRRGERWALIGPNGAGKTLLLKLLRGDLWPTPTGRERRRYGFDGTPRHEPAGSKEHIAYVGPERQDKYVRYGWNLTVTQVVTTGLFDEDVPLTRPTRAQRERVKRVLRRFGLWGLRARRLLTLSYGQRRLALVARAFAGNAQVLLLDEVFNGLDERAKDKLKRALSRPRSGHDWVLTSHRPKELPGNVTHVAYVDAGRIVHAGALEDPLPGPPPQAGEGMPSSSSQAKQGAPFSSSRAKQGMPFSSLQAKQGTLFSSLQAKQGRRATSLAYAPTPAAKGKRRVSSSRPRRAGESTSPWLVRIRNASLYRDYRPVIHALDWTIHRGEHWAVLGANGSGKSTLLSLIHGDLHPALGGTIERQGAPAGSRIEDWKQRVGWVSPELQADHYLAASIEEIVISGRYASVGLNQPPTAAERQAARRWMKFFGIDALAARGPRQVSYGQMRLALLARATVNDPELLLLDEPCTGLDGDVRGEVLAMIERLAREGTQLVMAVHDAEDIVPAVKNVLRVRRGGRVELGKR